MRVNPPSDPQQPQQNAARELEDPIRYAPHLVFIKELAALDDAMANGRDAWDAFDCWRSGIHAYAREDPVYKLEAKLVRAWIRKKQRRFNAIPPNMIIAKWRPTLIDVMRRAGMFNRIDAALTEEQAGATRDGAAVSAVKKKVNPK